VKDTPHFLLITPEGQVEYRTETPRIPDHLTLQPPDNTGPVMKCYNKAIRTQHPCTTAWSLYHTSTEINAASASNNMNKVIRIRYITLGALRY